MGKIRGRDYISWLWQYTAPYAGRIGLLLLFGLLETFASLAMVQITKEIIDAAANLKVIGVCSVGLNHVDMDACKAKGVQVFNAPGLNANAVAELTFSKMLDLSRHTIPANYDVKVNKTWDKYKFVGRELRGKTLGVLGFGRIARALVQKTSGFGFSKVLVYDPYVPAEACAALGAEKAELEDVLRQCDFLSLHMPVTPQTTGMINRDTLALMKPTAILVNTGRGPLVNDETLIEALQQKRILAAGLDTHCVEPIPADSPYRTLDNVVLTDHTAYSTVEAVEELKIKSAQNIINALTGVSPVYPVNHL